MKIVVIGGTGIIGQAVVAALQPRHEVVVASRNGSVKANIDDAASLRALFDQVRGVDAVVCCAGTGPFKPFAQLTPEDWRLGLDSKLMGQVQLARAAMERLADGGSITLTSGVLAREPMPGGVALSAVNAAVEGFVVGAAIELPRGERINVVSPPWISETLTKLGMDPKLGIPAAVCARAYVAAVEGKETGKVIDARRFA